MNPKPERSRLGELLLDMRLIDEDTLQAALADQRAQGKRLPSVLAQRGVIDEERLTKAVAARLGLEAVSVSSHKIHERVLALIPYAVSKKYGLLPIAIKRTQQAEVLYLIMIDPLNAEALGEVQRITGRQVRVLMCSATELDQAIDTQYKGLEARLAAARPPRPASLRPTPAPLQATLQPAQATGRTPARRGVSGVAARARPGSVVGRPVAAPAPPRATPPPLMPQKSRPNPSRPGDVRTPRPQTTPAPLRGRPAGPNLTPPVPSVPLVAPPLPAPPAARVPLNPAPSGASFEIPQARPVDIANPATLIDTARPPELDELSRRFVGGKWESMAPPALPAHELGPVMPSALEPPDSVSTRVEEDPSRVLVPRPLVPLSTPPPALVSPAVPVELVPAAPEPLPTFPPAPAPAALAPAKDAVDWDLGTQDWSAEAVWSGLDVADSSPEVSAAKSDKSSQEDQWSQSTGLDLQELAGMDDGPEEIPTSQLELSTESKGALFALPIDALSPVAPPAAASVPAFAPPVVPVPPVVDTAAADADRRLLARTLEVPIEIDDSDNPFGDPSPNAVRAGLERTGIFPAIDFDDDEFDPPSLESNDEGDGQLGLSDIPESPNAVQARFGGPDFVEDEDAIEAIEEVMLDPIEVEDPVDLGSMELPTVERPSPMPVTEAALMPVVEAAPTQDEARGRRPALPKRAPAPATLVFDESHERRPSPAESAEEPTNPRMEAPDVVPSTKAAPQVRLPTKAPLEHEGSEEPTPARETVERADVLDALEGAFVLQAKAVPASVPEVREDTPVPSKEPAPAVVATTPDVEAPASSRDDAPAATREVAAAAPSEMPPTQANQMVAGLVAGTSLDSSERAQMVLALGRLLISKGILSEADLVSELSRDDT